MLLLIGVLVGFVAFSHAWFLVLEMFLWQKPAGLKVNRLSPEHAQITAVLAANQGLYNGFLAAGLLLSFFVEPWTSLCFRVFFLTCVVVAGCYGAWTVSRRILFLQALPAFLALLAVGYGYAGLFP